jgi:hypothetical protein
MAAHARKTTVQTLTSRIPSMAQDVAVGVAAMVAFALMASIVGLIVVALSGPQVHRDAHAVPLTCEAKAARTVCVPTRAPSGSVVRTVEEDGSALYQDGAMYDGQGGWGQLSCWTEPKTSGPAERVCGDRSGAPVDARDFGPFIPASV